MDKATFLAEIKKLVDNYAPSPAVKAQLAQVTMVATVGPTGVGKTAVMERSGLPMILIDTTRELRTGETNGADINIRTDYEQLLSELKAGEFVQFVINHNGEFYGTKAAVYPLAGNCTLPIIARVIPLFRTYGFKAVIPVCIVPPDLEEWKRRIAEHGDADIAARLTEVQQSFGMALADPAYIFVLNDDLEQATKDFLAAANGQPLDPVRSTAARQAAETLLSVVPA